MITDSTNIWESILGIVKPIFSVIAFIGGCGAFFNFIYTWAKERLQPIRYKIYDIPTNFDLDMLCGMFGSKSSSLKPLSTQDKQSVSYKIIEISNEGRKDYDEFSISIQIKDGLILYVLCYSQDINHAIELNCRHTKMREAFYKENPVFSKYDGYNIIDLKFKPFKRKDKYPILIQYDDRRNLDIEISTVELVNIKEKKITTKDIVRLTNYYKSKDIKDMTDKVSHWCKYYSLFDNRIM